MTRISSCPLVSIMSAVLFVSCSDVNEQDFFNFEITEIGDKQVERKIDAEFVGEVDHDLDHCIIYGDRLITSTINGEYLISVSSIADNDEVECYFKKGRGPNELLMCVPISEFLAEGNDISAYLFSAIGGKLVKWNMSASMRESRAVCSDMVSLGSSDHAFLPLKSIYQLTDGNIIAYNTGQTDTGYRTPSYEIYDTGTGKLIKRLDLFDILETDRDDEPYSSSAYLSLTEAIHPGKDRLAFGMSYMPVLNILNLSDYSVKGVKISGHPDFSPDERIPHFVDLTADENYIYALYCGERVRSNSDYQKYLYVFDWKCNMKHKFELDFNATSLQLAGDRLYFLNFIDNTIYYEKLQYLQL